MTYLRSLLCLGPACLSAQAGAPRYQPVVEKVEARTLDYDVAVYGGTPAGVTAAVQAARHGESVVLISFNGFVGGMTSGGLTATDLGEKESVGGLALEFYKRVGKLKGFSTSTAEAFYLEMLEEAGVTLPSLPTMAKLSDALGVPLSALFEGLDHSPEISVTKKSERVAVDRDREHSDIVYHSLAHHRPNRRMDPFELNIPGKGGRNKALSHQGEEFLTVIAGKVTLEIGDNELSLAAGDSVYFNAEIPHRVLNPSSKEARILCVFLDPEN